jgi:predicted AAA+ superfamily ATPase
MKKYVPRALEKTIKERLFKGKIIIVYGARQVGKTTLVKKILADYHYPQKSRYLNCELLSVQNALAEPEAEKLKAYLGNFDLIVLDEAQNVPNVGKILKILIDTFPRTQIIATGSSSFDLAQKISEPLTGRTFTFTLWPFSMREIMKTEDLIRLDARLENFLRFGSYPEIFFLDENSARERLNEISSKYLYKDILSFEGLKKSGLVKNLLQALALQLGQEVSYGELAVQLGVNRLTVQKYIDILEQAFVLFKLNAFSRNLRKEIAKSVKVYFCDLGIRNSLIENFNRLEIRDDAGALWENFCILERRKNNEAGLKFVNSYFWRTYDQKEIDYIEETGGKITGFEFKLKNKKPYQPPRDFTAGYNASVQKVDRGNYWEFLGLSSLPKK